MVELIQMRQLNCLVQNIFNFVWISAMWFVLVVVFLCSAWDS